MTTWWRVPRSYLNGRPPAPVEATGETEKFVMVKGRREAKDSHYSSLHATEIEAWNVYVERARVRVENARDALEAAQKLHDELSLMRYRAVASASEVLIPGAKS